MHELSQGAKAVQNGRIVENTIASLLRLKGLVKVPAGSLESLRASRQGLWAEQGCFCQQCGVPLVAPCHRSTYNAKARVDFLIYTLAQDFVIISSKSQCSDGTAEEKLEFEIHQLIDTEIPAAMLVYGPMRGQGGATQGWSPDVLKPTWARAQHYGNNRIYLFRSVDRLTRWIEAGLPIARGGRTNSSISAEFCDREP
jgi:hypothetical protein